MRPRALAFSILVLATFLLLPDGAAAPGPGPARAQGTLMQCMEQCIRHEGGNSATNRETCKVRCANVPPAGAGRPAGDRDCMAMHKECLAACGRDGNCKSGCRKRLLNCK